MHADNYLPSDGCDEIRAAVSANPEIRCGAFKQKIVSDKAVYRMIEFGNARRIAWLGMAYGDQGIFVSRELFASVGGFDAIPLMEDFGFSRKLRAAKEKYYLCEGPVMVNPRRWESNGPIKQTFANWLMICKYLCGADAAELAQRY